jgi:predicted GNAT family N-acyltransferase
MEINEEIIIREIQYNSDEYRQELTLRDEVLRKPLGMSLFDENLEADEQDTHCSAFCNGQLVGTLLLKRVSLTEVKMRQVAVSEQFQSRKIGSKLVVFAEEFARSCGYKTMVLHARKTAVEFYLKQGYQKHGNQFIEVGIAHYEMSKNL